MGGMQMSSPALASARPPPHSLSAALCAPSGPQGRRLTTAWVGDSRAVLARADARTGELRALPLTQDHKPTCPGERERIEASGGRVDR